MKEFIKNMFSGTSDVSSKRVNGTVLIFSVLVTVLLSIIFSWEIKPTQENLLTTLFWGGTILLGVSVTEQYLKK
jgi:hypothetical protein